jgi:hypothetical protein
VKRGLPTAVDGVISCPGFYGPPGGIKNTKERDNWRIQVIFATAWS